MIEFHKLKTTPIKEVIFTISFEENVDSICLDDFKEIHEIKNRFSIQSRQYQAKIQETEELNPTSEVYHDGYMLKTDNLEHKVLQIRQGSFSFHKVDEYERFDTLLAEFEKYWKILVKCSSKSLSVNNISVRYLNFIEKEVGKTNKEIVNVFTHHPFTTSAIEFCNLRFNYEDINNEININIVATNGESNNIKNIILDIIVNKSISKSDDNSKLFEHMLGLRQIKNDIFFKCITDETFNKYAK